MRNQTKLLFIYFAVFACLLCESVAVGDEKVAASYELPQNAQQTFQPICIGFSQDETLIACGGGIESRAGCFVWKLRMEGPHLLTTISPQPNDTLVYAVAFARQGKELVTLSGAAKHDGAVQDVPCTISVWNLASGKERIKLNGHWPPAGLTKASLCVSSDDKTLASSVYRVILWDLASGAKKREFNGCQGPVFLRSRSLFALSERGNAVEEWDVETGERIGVVVSSETPFETFDVSSTGRHLAALIATPSGEVLLRDRENLTTAKIAVNKVDKFALHPNGSVLALPKHGVGMDLVDLVSAETHVVKIRSPLSLIHTRFSPTGRWIANCEVLAFSNQLQSIVGHLSLYELPMINDGPVEMSRER